MKATLPYLEEKFDEYNAGIFGGALPRVPLRLGRGTRTLGRCSFRSRRIPGIPAGLYDFRISVSGVFEFRSEAMLQDTLIHEMIHLEILSGGRRDSSAHGPLFRARMEEINGAFGRHITVSQRLTESEKDAVLAARPRRRHLIALVELADGRTGVRSLPLSGNGAARFLSSAMHSGFAKRCRLYLTDDPYFARFPRSSAPRVCIVDPAGIAARLAHAQALPF